MSHKEFWIGGTVFEYRGVNNDEPFEYYKAFTSPLEHGVHVVSMDAYRELERERDGARSAIEDRDKMHADHVQAYMRKNAALLARIEGLRSELEEIANTWCKHESRHPSGWCSQCHETVVPNENPAREALEADDKAKEQT